MKSPGPADGKSFKWRDLNWSVFQAVYPGLPQIILRSGACLKDPRHGARQGSEFRVHAVRWSHAPQTA